MRMDDFEGQYAHGFSIALDSVLCRAGVKGSSATGFRIVSDTLLFYRMVQGIHDKYGFGPDMSTSEHDFREGDTGKAPPFQNSGGRGTPKF